MEITAEALWLECGRFHALTPGCHRSSMHPVGLTWDFHLPPPRRGSRCGLLPITAQGAAGSWWPERCPGTFWLWQGTCVTRKPVLSLKGKRDSHCVGEGTGGRRGWMLVVSLLARASRHTQLDAQEGRPLPTMGYGNVWDTLWKQELSFHSLSRFLSLFPPRRAKGNSGSVTSHDQESHGGCRHRCCRSEKTTRGH